MPPRAADHRGKNHLSQHRKWATVEAHETPSRIEDLALGSNAERLLHDSTSSVLITRG
jgi:nucleotide-binding universal stress UspA family protein